MSTKITVALVDDDIDFLENIYILLSSRNPKLDIDKFHNPLEALCKIKEKRHDLIITDHIMPNIDGLELIKRVKAVYRPSIVLLSGMHQAKLIYVEQVDSYIRKPFDINVFNSKIERLLEEINNNKINKIISSNINQLDITSKDKFFLEDVVKAMLKFNVDKRGIYKILVNELRRDETTIRRNINRICKGGLEDKNKLKSVEFINTLLDKISTQIQAEGWEIEKGGN